MSDPLDWLDDALTNLDRRGLRRSLVERVGPQRGDRIEITDTNPQRQQGTDTNPQRQQGRARRLINFGSNDYLGLAADPRIAAAAKQAIDETGWGAGASPLVTGRSALHAELERKLAEFEGTEAAILFPSGYAANVGTIAALVGKGDAIYSDELNHASIIDGCRLSGAVIEVFAHRDLGQLKEHLLRGRSYRQRLIVTDSVFSMTGDVAPLAGLVELAERHGAMLLVDEAHATGVFGEHGRGWCEEVRVDEAVPIRVGTLSKSLGSHGGFVAGSQRLIDWLANRARPYVFSTAAPPAASAAALTALEIVHKEPHRRTDLRELAISVRRQLLDRGLSYGSSFSQIIPMVIGDPRRVAAAAAELRERGYFVPGIRPPSVPEGQSLLRISLTCLHTSAQIDALVDALVEITG